MSADISEHIFAPNGDYRLYIHEPEANNCFSIITQVIKEIPKQRNVTILPQFAIVDKSSPRCSHQCVTQCLFELVL